MHSGEELPPCYSTCIHHITPHTPVPIPKSDTCGLSNPLTPKNFKKNPEFHLLNIEKQMVPCKSTAEEVSFEWSHHRTTLRVSISDPGRVRVNIFSIFNCSRLLFVRHMPKP